MIVRELYSGSRYRVRFVQCDERRWAVVSFAYWQTSPTLEGDFAAEGFFRDRGLNAIGIMAAENDWFQNAEIEPALDAIRGATKGFELIGYGGSMGAYAAVNFADRLDLRRVIAVCPQYSIDTGKAPYETRWRPEAAAIVAGGGFLHDRIDEVSPPVEGWIVFDPSGVDAKHAAAICARHALTKVPVRFAGHHEMRLLQQTGLLTPMLIDMLTDRFDPTLFLRQLRSARRRSAVFWIGFSSALVNHRRLAAALRAIRKARRLPHPDRGQIDMQEAWVHEARGDHERALALANARIADAGWSWAAAPLATSLAAAIAARPADKPRRRLLRFLFARRPKS